MLTNRQILQQFKSTKSLLYDTNKIRQATVIHHHHHHHQFVIIQILTGAEDWSTLKSYAPKLCNAARGPKAGAVGLQPVVAADVHNTAK